MMVRVGGVDVRGKRGWLDPLLDPPALAVLRTPAPLDPAPWPSTALRTFKPKLRRVGPRAVPQGAVGEVDAREVRPLPAHPVEEAVVHERVVGARLAGRVGEGYLCEEGGGLAVARKREGRTEGGAGSRRTPAAPRPPRLPHPSLLPVPHPPA